MKNKTIFTTVLLFCFTVCFAMTTGLNGKWTGNAESPNGSVEISYNFNVDGQTLTGSVQGPQGTVDLMNGTYKDSILAFDIMVGGSRGILHQSGKYYGDSIVLDFTIRSGPVRMKLLKNK